MKSSGGLTRVVVGLDGVSSESDPVLTAALLHARLASAELHLVHALAVSLPRFDGADPNGAYRAAVAGRPAQIKGAIGQLRVHVARHFDGDRPEPAVIFDVRHGDPATVLLMAAQHADLVVVGTYGRRRDGRHPPFLLGSVSQDVALNADCPVLLIPRTRPQADTTNTGSLGQTAAVYPADRMPRLGS